MTDTFNVTASYDKQSYAAGDTITITISGGDVLTTTTQASAGPLTVHIAAADGATQDLILPAVPVTVTTSTPESLVVTGVTDTSAKPLAWSVGATGLTVSAVFPKP